MEITHYALMALIAIAPTVVWASATITAKPNTNHPQGKITIAGSGFAANESINVRWDNKKLLFTITSDSSGAFPKQKTKVPKSALPGTHTINAAGADGDSAQVDFVVSTVWAEHGFTEVGTRNNPYENVISASNAGGLTEAWSANTHGAVWSSPAVANGLAYVGSLDGSVYAFDVATGSTIWTRTTGSAVYSSPAVVNGTVYIGSYDNRL